MGILNIRWLVNFGLLIIPIGVTLGILFGIDAHRHASGQAPLYTAPAGGGDGDGGSSGGGGGSGTPDQPKTNNGITKQQYCQKSYGFTPKAKGQEYTLNPNQWGWDASDGGGLCMNVTMFNNGTYATKTTAPVWSITWQYPQGPDTQPVHAFPNIMVDGGVFPAAMGSISQIGVDVKWTYGVGNDTAATTDEATLTATTLNANVAIDMFLDSKKANSGDSAKAAYEVMVWFADFGDAAQPIGMARGAVTTETVNGTSFSLYTGQNSLKQNVLTWVATTTTDNFQGDISPLITKLFSLTSSSAAEYPAKSDYLGYMAFGSEAYYSTDFVTFTVPQLSFDVRTS